jgi:hypothetical protein
MSDPEEGPGIKQDNARSLHDETQRYTHPHQVIKNYALEVAQLMFAEGNPMGFCWDADQAKTQIVIVDKYSFNLDQVGVTPAIVANRGPLQWMRTSGFRQMQNIDMRTDTRTHTDLVQGSVVLSCFSRSGLEAENIAGYLFEGFQVLRDVLRKVARRGIMVPNHLGFFKVEATNMGEEALVKSDSRPELSVVPIAIQAMVQRRYTVTPKNTRKLRDIVVRTSRSGTQ